MVPDLGRDVAGDATVLSARAAKASAAQQEIAAGLPQPSGGREEYTDDEGTVTKVVEWFGYKLHLLIDVKHEVSLASCFNGYQSPLNTQTWVPLQQASTDCISQCCDQGRDAGVNETNESQADRQGTAQTGQAGEAGFRPKGLNGSRPPSRGATHLGGSSLAGIAAKSD